jgi:hypothetical protein
MAINRKIPLMVVAMGLIVAIGSQGAMSAYSTTDNYKNWGQASKELAQSDRTTNKGSMGEHASGQDEPRFGLGNVKKLCETSMKDLADELTTGQCPPS